MTFVFSMTEWNLLMGNGAIFNWGKNYVEILKNREFWDSLVITFYYTILVYVILLLL